MHVKEKCVVCGTIAEVSNVGGSWKIECPRCGTYSLSKLAQGLLDDLSGTQRVNLSGWLREQNGKTITPEDLPFLKAIRTPTVGEKGERLMRFFGKQNPKPGAYIKFPSPETLRATCWALDDDESSFILSKYLMQEKEYLVRANDNYGNDSLRISPKGWAYLDSLGHGNPESQIGFIAMWFDDSVKDAWTAIDKGVRDAGYRPFRVDQKEHNNDITDEIIAGIRGSKFLVADLTKHRNGVYFEAGFARGLGLEVVWLCRKSDEKDRHFDIRQLNCIFWEEDKLPELTKALANRIVATIGRGPLAANT